MCGACPLDVVQTPAEQKKRDEFLDSKNRTYVELRTIKTKEQLLANLIDEGQVAEERPNALFMIQALHLVTEATTDDGFNAHMARKNCINACVPFISHLLLNYADTKFENLDDFIDQVCKLTQRLVHWKATMSHILGGFNWHAGTMNPGKTTISNWVKWLSSEQFKKEFQEFKGFVPTESLFIDSIWHVFKQDTDSTIVGKIMEFLKWRQLARPEAAQIILHFNLMTNWGLPHLEQQAAAQAHFMDNSGAWGSRLSETEIAEKKEKEAEKKEKKEKKEAEKEEKKEKKEAEKEEKKEKKEAEKKEKKEKKEAEKEEKKRYVKGQCYEREGKQMKWNGRKLKKVCSHDECEKETQGGTDCCKLHGGGKRCKVEGCKKGAQGGTGCCIEHGGGKRCKVEGCKKGAQGVTDCCIEHGGGKRCKVEGCKTGARGDTGCCRKHGGGKRCKVEGCKTGARGDTGCCIKHGGGVKKRKRA